MFRKILAGFLVLLIGILAIPLLVVFGLSRTYFNEDFYQKEVVGTSYNFLVSESVAQIYDANQILQANFSKADFEKVIRTSFTENMYGDVLNDFVKQIMGMVKGEEIKLSLNLQLFRDSLLTAMNTLAYQIYQKLPTCSEEEAAKLKFGNDLPTCVPAGLDYDIVVSPLVQSFQNEVFQKIPKEISNIDQQLPVEMLKYFFWLKNVLFIILVVLLSLIALLMWKPFSALVLWEGIALVFAGLIGLLMSLFNFSLLGVKVGEGVENSKIIEQLLVYLTDEIRNLALMFLIIGVALFVVRVIIKRTMEYERIALG